MTSRVDEDKQTADPEWQKIRRWLLLLHTSTLSPDSGPHRALQEVGDAKDCHNSRLSADYFTPICDFIRARDLNVDAKNHLSIEFSLN